MLCEDDRDLSENNWVALRGSGGVVDEVLNLALMIIPGKKKGTKGGGRGGPKLKNKDIVVVFFC